MPAIPADSPFQRLDFDLLYCIVEMNASMFDDRGALETTLATSRVCRDWRTSMLGMSSIWAHLIDLDRLHWRTVEFRREMIRRSGSVFLWIKASRCVGHHRTDPIRCIKYVFNMIAEYSGQIQRLEANIAIEYVGPLQWKLLDLPAPHLESLNLIFSRPKHNFERSFLSLFSGCALMLHTMVLDARLTVSEVFGVLILAQNLVNLRLYVTVVPGDTTTSPLPFFALPKLAHLVININTDLKEGTILLDRMRIPPPCSMNISVDYRVPRNPVNHKSTLGPIIRSVSICAQNYFTHHAPTKIFLEQSNGTCTFEDQTHPGIAGFKFSIRIPMLYCFQPHTRAMLLREFIPLDFSQVTKFKFEFLAEPRAIPELTTFMTCLSSIQILETGAWTLDHLIRIQQALKTADTGPSIVFPSLKTLKLHSYFFDSASRLVIKFLMACIADGHPIDILDLTWQPYDVMPDMAFLKEADGLKVLWRRDEGPEVLEYICGTNTSRSLLSV